jgi:hypothetical protein
MHTEKRSLIWRMIYHPMFVISVAVHAAVLLTPLPEEPAAIEEPETQEEIIGLASLTTAPPPDPEPEPEPEPEPAPAPSPEPTPQPQTQNPNPNPVPDPEPTESTQPAEPTEPSEPTEPTEPTPPFDPTVPRQQFVSSLADLEGDVTAMGIVPRPQDVEVPDAFFDSNGNRRDGINEFRWLNDRRIEEVYTSLESRYSEAGITFEPIEPGYGGGDLYALKTEDGEPFFYLNLAPASSGGVSTILVVWAINPLDPEGRPSPPPTD